LSSIVAYPFFFIERNYPTFERTEDASISIAMVL